MAERVGFEPTIPLRVCRISSAVLSTTQPPLRSHWSAHGGAGCLIAATYTPCKSECDGFSSFYLDSSRSLTYATLDLKGVAIRLESLALARMNR